MVNKSVGAESSQMPSVNYIFFVQEELSRLHYVWLKVTYQNRKSIYGGKNSFSGCERLQRKH